MKNKELLKNIAEKVGKDLIDNSYPNSCTTTSYKKDEETDGAKLRNVLSPFVVYFQLKDKLNKGEFNSDKIEAIGKILINTEMTCINELDRLVKLCKVFD